MQYGYIDNETGAEAIAIIKEIKEIGNELVIKFVDGTHRVEDLNDANVEAALAIMEKQAKERNESGEKEKTTKTFQTLNAIRTVIASSTAATTVALLATGAVQENNILAVVPIALVAAGLVTEVKRRKVKGKKEELDKYACFLEIKDEYEELYDSKKSAHMVDNLHAGTEINEFLTINDIDKYSKEDILTIARNIENIKALDGVFIDSQPKVNNLKRK